MMITLGTKDDQWLAQETNQIQLRNVQGRMFHRLLATGRELSGRVRKWMTTKLLLAGLLLVTLAYRTGMPIPPLNRQVVAGFQQVWSDTKQEAIRFQSRVRMDYQAVWLAYSVTRQFTNVQAQPAKRSWEQCHLTETPEIIQGRMLNSAVPSVARNWQRDCFR
jgi:hypothetical protein